MIAATFIEIEVLAIEHLDFGQVVPARLERQLSLGGIDVRRQGSNPAPPMCR